MKYNVWVNDCGWHISGGMPLDGCGVPIGEAKREYGELVFEYATSSLMILPAYMEIADLDESGVIGGMYAIRPVHPPSPPEPRQTSENVAAIAPCVPGGSSYGFYAERV